MNKTLLTIAALATLASTAACSDDKDTIDLSDYTEWREQNDKWVEELRAKTGEDGKPYYNVVTPVWNPGTFILMHSFTDPDETAGNLTPLYTSTVDVIYEGYDCTGRMFDSSKNETSYGRKGVSRFTLNRTIEGFAIALERMQVGDSVEIIVPYGAAYGTTASQNIDPYTSIRFNLRLVDIYRYERPTY